MTGKKKIFLSILIVILIMGCIGFYLYNKVGVDVQNSSGTKTTAEELYETFSTDSVAAKMNCTGRILEVSGEVTQLSKNQQNHEIILLKTAAAGASVNCTMEQTGIKIKSGDKITIKGICGGIGQGDTDLGILGDVYLLRCYLSK